MYFLSNISALLCIAAFAGAAPLCSETSITQIAGGGPPTGEFPKTISVDAIKELQLAFFLKTLEVSFFNTGLENFTSSDIQPFPNGTLEDTRRIAAQKEVHLSSLSGLLSFYQAAPISACNYSFPVRGLNEFLDVGRAITSAGLSAMIGLQERLAIAEPLLTKLVSSMVAVEARHDTILRHAQGTSLSPTPFDAGITDLWAYNLALTFIQPGSCSVGLPIPILPQLTISQTSGQTSTNKTRHEREFSWDPTQTSFVTEAGKKLYIGWVTQLDKPLYTLLNITTKGKGTVEVPQGLNGVVFAVVTVKTPDSTNDLASGSLTAPAIIFLT